MRLLILALLFPFAASAQSYMLTTARDTIKMIPFRGAQWAYIYLKKDWPSIPAGVRQFVEFLPGDGEEGTGAADTAKLYLNGPMQKIRAGYRPPGNICFVMAPQRSALVNDWDETDQNNSINIANSLGASVNKRVISGYSGGASGTFYWTYSQPTNWAAAHAIAGAAGSEGVYVESGYALKSIPGYMVSHGTADVTQNMSNSNRSLDSTLANNALNPYLMETDYYFGVNHGAIDDTVYNKIDQYFRWYALHDRRYDSLVRNHVDSLERGFDDHFWRKTKRLVDSMATGSLKTSYLGRVQKEFSDFYGTDAARYPVVFSNQAKSAAGWKNSTTNVAGAVTSGLINAVNNTVSSINLTQVSAGSTQERVYTRNYNQYHGLPPGFYAQPFEMFSNVSKFRYSNLPNGNYWVVIDGTSETISSTQVGLRVTINAVTTTLPMQYRNTNKYVWRGPFAVSGGTLDVDIQDLIAGGVGHVATMELIKEGSFTPVNQPPTVDAGTNQTISLPTTTATLTGSASDADGSLANTTWSKVSGPAGGTITSASTTTTGITALQAGRYVFQLSATDNEGAVTTDTVAVQVNDALKGTAGTDYWIPMQQGRPQLPFTITFTDTAGVSTGWAWTKLSGSGTLSNTTSRTVTVSNIALGGGTYRVVATSAGGATVSDTISINLRDLVNGRGREYPCRVGAPVIHKVGGVKGSGTDDFSFSMQYVKRDNRIPGLMGGDIIMLLDNPNNPNGEWRRATIGDLEFPPECPCKLVPDSSGDGIVRITDTLINNTGSLSIGGHDSAVAKNLIVDGTYNFDAKNVVYGFEIGNPTTDNTKYFYRGVTGNYLNNVTLKGIALFNCSTGFSLKTISDSSKPFKIYDHYRNTIYIEDCYMDSAINEFNYLGTTDPPGLGQGNDGPAPKGNYISGNRLIMRGSGWDAWQVSFFSGASLKNSVILRTGIDSTPGQIFSGFMGGKVGPAVMDSNFFRYQVGGPGFLGEGKSSFRNNIVWDYQQMYNSQSVVTGMMEAYDSLQIFNEYNYYIGQTGASYGVVVANTGGEKFKPGTFRNNTILTNKTIGTFFSSAYSDTVASNTILSPALNADSLLNASRLDSMPSYLMYKYIAANPTNRKPSFYDVYAPVDPPDPNQPPVVSIAPVAASSATSVQLFGSATDPDGTATVAWTQTAGTAATITGGTTLSPTITGLTVGSRTFRMRATDDDGATADAFVTVVTTANLPPTVPYITPTSIITEPSGITLQVSASDPEGQTLTYTWSVLAFNPVSPSLSGNDGTTVDVTGMVAGSYTFQVVVSDGVNTVTRTVAVTVNPAVISQPTIKFRYKGRLRRKTT